MMINRIFIFKTLYFILILSSSTASASIFIQSQSTANITLKGYSGLSETILFQGELAAEVKYSINTTYKGLALLLFEQGQAYPVVLEKHPFLLTISSPDTQPSFMGSETNEYLYALLNGVEPDTSHNNFSDVMIEAKQLLASTSSVHTVDELQTTKEKLHVFVRTHYQDLYHSDILRRLIAQYFMMHEYIDYHVSDAPTTDIRVRYQNAVMDGVRNWLEILQPNISQHEILNYCVSLYFDRSMVTLASRIMKNFSNVAYCPGEENKTFSFPSDVIITDANGNRERQLDEIKGNRIIAFVSDDCPVSMVETISKVRQLADQKKDTVVIIAPLQKLSEKHLSMRRMVSGGNMFFINDEKWRKENLAKKIKLPLFHHIGGTLK